MSTQFTNRQWRLPNEENKSKVSNYSMDFDSASSDYIETNSNSLTGGLNKLSLSLWVNPTNISSWRNIISLGNGNLSPNSFIEVYSYSTQSSSFRIEGSIATGGYVYFDYTPFVSNNNWYHLAIVWDSTESTATDRIKVYINGTLRGNLSGLTSSFNINGDIKMGRTWRNTSNTMDGKIDGVSIYNYALSSSQITTLYGSSSTGIGNPMSLSPKPVAYYPLGDQDSFNGANYLTPNASLKDFVFDFVSADYVTLNSTINLTGNKTVSYWVNPDSLGDVYIAGDRSNYYSYMTSSLLYIKDSTGYSAFNISVSTGKWYHICITGDGTNATLYINGDFISTINDRNPTIDTIGAYNDGGYSADAKMSNVQIFNTALPATGSNSVETLYNNGSPLTSMTGFTSLVSWYKLNASDTYDGTNWTIEDHAGSNDGTSSGMTQANLVQSDLSFTSGYSPYALDFDGANDAINISNNSVFNLGNSFTISGWFNFAAIKYQGLISFDSSSTRGWFLYQLGNNIKLFDGSSAYTLKSSYTTTNQWYSFIVTYDGTDLVFYVNGIQESTQAVSVNPQTNGNDGQIGNNQAGSGIYYNGSISNLSIWNTALISAQVTEIYSEGIPQNLNNHSAVSSLVSWWQLGSNSSFNTNWTVLDEKGSNNGTSVNMGEDAIVDGVGSYANGLSSGMSDAIVGDAPYSSSNSLSVNMDVLDRVEDTPS